VKNYFYSIVVTDMVTVGVVFKEISYKVPGLAGSYPRSIK